MRNRFMRAFIAIVLGGAVTLPLAARGESLAAFDGRCIPAPPQRGCRVGDPGPGCVARRSHVPDILTPRALPGGRLAALGARAMARSDHYATCEITRAPRGAIDER